MRTIKKKRDITYELESIPKEYYLQLTLCGYFSGDATEQVVDTMARAYRNRSLRWRNFLVDIQSLNGKIQINDRFHIAVYAAKNLEHDVRIALLAREDQIMPCRFLETVARNRGLDLRVFFDHEEAVAWLTFSAG